MCMCMRGDVYSSTVFLELSFLLIFGNCLAGLFILFWEVVTTALFYVSKNPKMMNSFAGNSWMRYRRRRMDDGLEGDSTSSSSSLFSLSFIPVIAWVKYLLIYFYSGFSFISHFFIFIFFANHTDSTLTPSFIAGYTFPFLY